jgi:hypothetical protein
MPQTCPLEGCEWLVGQKFILTQDDDEACKWCYIIDDFCFDQEFLEICFFLSLRGGTPDTVYGQLAFTDGFYEPPGGPPTSYVRQGTTSLEWQISPTAPIDCTTVNETLTQFSPFFTLGANNANKHDCRYGEPGFSYTIKSL